jgi:hypothetical protein
MLTQFHFAETPEWFCMLRAPFIKLHGPNMRIPYDLSSRRQAPVLLGIPICAYALADMAGVRFLSRSRSVMRLSYRD